MRRSPVQTVEYVGLLAGVLILAWVLGAFLGSRIDKDAYDEIFRRYRPPDWQAQSIVLAIDEESYQALGEEGRLRGAIAEGLERIAKVAPKAVAIDMVLAERNPSDDRLAAAIRTTPNVVLACYLLDRGAGCVDPLPRFSSVAAGKGHAYAEQDPVFRAVELEKAA